DAASVLADWAIECRAAALHDAGDRSGATGLAAGLALAVIDREGMLEIAERSVGMHIVAQRRAAGLDRVGDDRADRRCKPFGALAHLAARRCDRAGRAPWRQAGAPQRFRHIYIAEAGNQRLVEESRLERRLPAAQQIGK